MALPLPSPVTRQQVRLVFPVVLSERRRDRSSQRTRVGSCCDTVTLTPASAAWVANTCASCTTPPASVDVISCTFRSGMAGGLQQRLRLRDVPDALRQTVVEVGINDSEHVVADTSVTFKHLLEHLRTVDDQPQGLPDPHIGERRLVDTHRESAPSRPSPRSRPNRPSDSSAPRPRQPTDS